MWEYSAFFIFGAVLCFNAGVIYILALKAVTKADLLLAMQLLRKDSDDRYVDQKVCEATHKAQCDVVMRLQNETDEI